MTDAPAEKPSVALSILAALLCLGGPPVGFTLFVMLTHGGEDVAMAWNEGGAGMYGILGLAVLAMLVSVAGAFFAPRGVPAVMGAALTTTVLVMGASGAAYRFGANGSFKAIQHASPLDQQTIMWGALGELNALVFFAAALVAGLLLSQGAALVVASFASRTPSTRRALSLGGFALLCLGGWQFFTAMNASAERDMFSALARGEPMDRLTLIVDGFDRMASSRAMAMWPLLTALVVVVAGVVALRKERGAAAAVLFGVLVPLVGLAGFRAMARAPAQVIELATTLPTSRELMVVDSSPLDARELVLGSLGAELRDDRGTPLSPEELAARLDFKRAAIGLEPGVKAEALSVALAQVLAAGAETVTLVGQKRTEPPPFVPGSWHFVFTERRGLTFGVTTASKCERCELASITQKELVDGSEKVPLATSSFALVPREAHKVYVKLEGLTLEQILAIGHTAASRSQLPVLVLAD